MASSRLFSKFVVLDIDGVILKGGSLIPGAAEAVRKLSDNGIPYVFVTNGGGMTEAKKAADLTKKVGIPVLPSHVVLSHTPWKDLKDQYANSKVLVVGGQPRCLEVAHCYGFSKACTIDQIHAEHPTMYPLRHPCPKQATTEDPSAPIEAVMVFHDPVDWGLEMQVISDALDPAQLLAYPSLATPDNLARGHIPLYVSNADLAYATEHPHPRFTQGAFALALKHLYEAHHRHPLTVDYCGKPYSVQYEYASQLLHQQVHGVQAPAACIQNIADPAQQQPQQQTQPQPQDTTATAGGIATDAVYFGVGDNPLSDIRGANAAGPAWRSVLVRTGMFRDRSAANDPVNPAHYVCEDIVEAVQVILDYPAPPAAAEG